MGKPKTPDPRTERLSVDYHYRVVSVSGTAVRTLWEGPNMAEGQVVASREGDRARRESSPEIVSLDAFVLERRRRWVTRLYQSKPPQEPRAETLPGRKGGPRILFLPLEFPVWVEARGWSYAAQLAYARALRELGCTVTVVNSLILDRCRNVLEGKKFDQVWTHLHYRHADGQMFRDWVAETAPVRMGLAGETVHYPKENPGTPWERNHQINYADWRPFLTHVAFGDPADVGEEIYSQRKSKGPQATNWHQAVPRDMVRPVGPPRFQEGVFCGAPYTLRDSWLAAPELKGILRVLPSPEDGTGFAGKFESSHRLISSWLLSRRAGASLASRLYDRRVSGLRKWALGRFIEALSQGMAVVNLPSMFRGESGRVVEGMASGRPVVAFRGPGAAASPFEEGQEILRYETPGELAELVQKLRSGDIEDWTLAGNARQALLSRHTVERRARELLAFASG